jgi:ribonuclease R
MKKEKKGANAGSVKSPSRTEITGILDITRSGMGFVIVEGMEKDIVVRPDDFNNAFHGDRVQIELKTLHRPGKRLEGMVKKVLERRQVNFVGSIKVSKHFAFFIPDGDKSLPDFYIPLESLNDAVEGDKVVVRIGPWEGGAKKPQGEVVKVLRAEDLNDVAMKQLLTENGFPLEFDAALLEEAAGLSDKITREEERKRKDFRDILTFTIDPVDARDFDDAISIRNLDNGYYEVGVHIADVSHFVKPGTAMDAAAYERATSVYLPDRVCPMLPERISNELCSLRPDEDKYTFSVVFQITNRGEIKHTWIGRTLIHSNHRFTYEDVQQIIETGEGPHNRAVLLLNNLARQFRKERFEAGAINFSSQEVRFTLDEHGHPTGIVVKESKESHQLVEEFMLLANRAVAEYVSKISINGAPLPFPYRIHDTPDEEKLLPFAAFAKKFGYEFNLHDEKAVAASFNNLLRDVQGKPEQHVLEQLGIRTMAKAQYTPENIGHYGLGFTHYCHFTSPIRRYPDVLVHRILQTCLDKQVKPDMKLAEQCRHCSERERKAMECERAANKYKQVEYMQQFVGEEFAGVINGVAAFGFFVETVQHKCEGMVTVRDLATYDDFRHNEADYALQGLRTGKKFRMGDAVTIQVVAANLEKRQLDYHWVPAKGDLVARPAVASASKKTTRKKK